MHLSQKKICSADKIFINGSIYSIDDSNNKYELMAIKDGKIIGLGTNKEINRYVSEKTEIIDLKQKLVLPGFIDAHSYISEKNIMNKDSLSLFNSTSIEEYLILIQNYVDCHTENKIIYGAGWNCEFFEDNEAFKGPRKKWLNKINTDKPIVLQGCGNYALWLNDKAFEYFNINKNTKSPIGGKIELDDAGELWGTLKGNATRLVDLRQCVEYDENEYFNGFVKYQNKLHSYGVTTISPINNGQLEMPLKIYKKLEKTNTLKLRISYGFTIMPKEICGRSIYEQLHKIKRDQIIYKTDLFDLSRVKFFADGITEMATAYLFNNYREVFKNDLDYRGLFMWKVSEFKEAIKMANRFEFDVCIHAKGDLACKLAIDGIEYSDQNNENHNYRNSLLCIDLITQYYIRRMKLLNINAIIQPFWFYKNPLATKNETLVIGEERVQREYPFKSLVDVGIVTAGASDYSVSEILNPFKAIECAITRNLYTFTSTGFPTKIDMNSPIYRLNPNERVSIIEAIRTFTINAAYILKREDEIGSLEVGKKADFIVLDKNIFTVHPLDICNIKVLKTYFNGELVYEDISANLQYNM